MYIYTHIFIYSNVLINNYSNPFNFAPPRLLRKHFDLRRTCVVGMQGFCYANARGQLRLCATKIVRNISGTKKFETTCTAYTKYTKYTKYA